MKEIGGYLQLEKLISNEYHSGLLSLNTARNALAYLIEAKSIKKVYVPYYLCDSVFEVCKREKCDFEYYHIDKNFRPLFDEVLKLDEYLYIVNYFGQIDNEEIIELKYRYKNIIIDNVQAFFQKPVDDVDTIYSCRKFIGVADGAYLSTNVVLNRELEYDVSADRMKHILGRFEVGNASEFYNDFKYSDESFADVEVRYMSRLTHNIMGAVDYQKITSKREENFSFLHSRLSGLNKLEIKCPIGPYMYPFYCENGMDIKKKLAKEKVYVPTLWPNVNELDCVFEKDLSQNILPLPCDQRYSLSDMEYMINKLKSILV